MLMWVYKIIVSKILVNIITHNVFEDLDYLRSEAYWSLVISSRLRSFFKYRYNIYTLPVVRQLPTLQRLIRQHTERLTNTT